ncbi:MAG TPA: DMT family transporter [Nitrospira sp.]|nr:DMT family transporter [Nitrospira sp.]
MKDRPVAAHQASTTIPLLCLMGVVVLLTSVTLVIKYVFQHSDVQPMGMASVRVGIGFVLLCAMTLLWDWRGLLTLSFRDIVQLTLVGTLGVLSYAVAASGLMRTSVTHYVLIYSLLPSTTAVASVLIGREWFSTAKMVGVALSLAGCLIAVSGEGQTFEAIVGIGDALVLLFTIMMSAHIVCSAGIVKRFGAMVANTVMFGSSALILFAGSWQWSEPRQGHLTLFVLGGVVYVGIATAGVFVLRYRALQALPPTTVGTYHNLIPICTIVAAAVFLGESVGLVTIAGSGMVVTGAELVRRAHFPKWLFDPAFAKRIAVTLKPSR